MPSLRTLRDLVRVHYSIHFHCSRCGHDAQQPAADLMARLGADFTLDALWKLAKCSACGARPPDVRLQMASDGRPK